MALSTYLLASGAIDRDGPIRWGVMGAGLISRDFVGALKALSPEEGVVVAVGARELEDAAAFARELSVERAHEGYEALAADPDVDVIYVGTVAQAHVQCAQIALAAGKHVVVEKPLALCVSDAEALTREARERGLFLLEGMWTRCFPAVHKARELLAAGAIGEVVAVSADFGWAADPAVHARTLDPRSGGVCLDVAMYPVAHVLLAAGAGMPRVVATGTSKPAASGGGVVDWSVGAALSWPSGVTATVLCTLGGATSEEAVYTGTKGTLRILRPAHAPSRLHLSVAAGRQASEDEALDFPLPPKPAGALRFNYPGSEGFVYEARAVHAALRAGKLELDEWTHAESVTTQAIIDAMREAVVSA